MVFDIMAWGVTFIVGFVMGLVYERSKIITNLLGWKSIRVKYKEKMEDPESEKVV